MTRREHDDATVCAEVKMNHGCGDRFAGFSLHDEWKILLCARPRVWRKDVDVAGRIPAGARGLNGWDGTDRGR